MKNIAVYPYSQEFEPAMKYSQFLDADYNIKALVAPRGVGLHGSEVHYKKNGAKGNYLIVQSSLSVALQDDIDTLLIPHFTSNSKYEAKVVDSIINSINCFDNIICYKQFANANHTLLLEKCESNNRIFDDRATPRELSRFSFGSSNVLDLEKYDPLTSELHDIDVPIIIVAGMGENTDKLEVSLALMDMLQNKGYKTSHIGSKNYCELLGFHSFPSFMFHPQIDDQLKIICFNNYVKHIETEERPDIIILTIPGAIRAFSAKITQGFGLLHYMVFQAVLADYLVMCSYLVNIDAIDHLKRDSIVCKNKFGCSVDCYHISSSYVDFNSSDIFRRIITNNAPIEAVNEIIMDINMDSPLLINIFDGEGRCKLYDDVIAKLNPDFVLV